MYISGRPGGSTLCFLRSENHENMRHVPNVGINVAPGCNIVVVSFYNVVLNYETSRVFI